MNRANGYVNLNTVSAEWLAAHAASPDTPNPLLDPAVSTQMVVDYHTRLGLAWSQGGWLEPRPDMHRGTYLEGEKLWLHLGVDVNIDVGTEVRALADGPIVYAATDAPLVGGWGYHVIQIIEFRSRPHALIYAHLAQTPLASVSSNISKGAALGAIGAPYENGGWFPHVHLQLFADVAAITNWKKFSNDMDGYGTLNDRDAWAETCPDPTPLIFA